MVKILNLGTAVKIKDEIGIIMGFVIAQSEGRVKPRYIVLPYPEGYKGADSLKLFDIDAVEGISDGYSSELSNNVIQAFEGLNTVGEHLSYEEFVEYIKNHSDELEEL